MQASIGVATINSSPPLTFRSAQIVRSELRRPEEFRVGCNTYVQLND
jgi:hypothetical protein